MSRFHRRRGTTSDLRGRLSRRWLAAAAALALAFGSAPAQAAPFVYVTSSSGPPGYGGEVFQYDAGAGGLLTPLSPPTVAVGGRAGAVAVSPDGKSVYVAGNSGPPGNVGEVFQYDVGAGGTLSPKSPPTVATGDVAGSGPSEVAVSPDGKSVYVTASSGAPGDPAYQSYVMQYDVGVGGALSPKSPAMVVAPFSVFCSTSGAQTSCSGADFSAGGVAVSPDGKSVYVAGYLSAPFGLSHPSVVLQYDVGAGGALSPKNPPSLNTCSVSGCNGGQGAGAVAVSPDGQSVYVANPFSDTVSQYDVGAGGELSPKDPATVGAGIGPVGVAVAPDGKSVYVSDTYDPAIFGSGDVSQYDVGAGGALSPKSPATVLAGSRPRGVAVSPDGRSVYVTNLSSDNVSQYDVGPGGALSPKSPATVAAGHYPAGVAVSPLVPTSKEQCKRGGWREFPQFRNEGGCVSFVQKHGNQLR